ncbi:MAG: hypothetical protein M3P08_07680 [Thermoproteota archaeon]|nr:hypothetical protein [Thermoproteota archaeon]
MNNKRQDDPTSPHVKLMKERREIKIALWSLSGNKKPKCDLCKQSLVTPALSVGEKPYMMCPSCGKRTTAEDIKDRQTKTLTATSSKAGPMIVSQVRKKRRPDSLDEQNGLDPETLEDLAQAGLQAASWNDYFPT